MPLYEYECDACGRRFERIQKYSDPPIDVCPTCGGHVHKLLSSPAIQFKGSGWYITDYARKGGSSGEAGGTEKKGSSTEPSTAVDTSAKDTPSKEPPAKESSAKESSAKESNAATGKQTPGGKN